MRALTFATLAILLCFLLLRKTHIILTTGLHSLEALPEITLHSMSVFIHLMLLFKRLWAWLFVVAINALSLLLTLILLFTQSQDMLWGQNMLWGILLENLLMLTLLLANYKHFFADIFQHTAPAYRLETVDLLPYPGRNNLARKDHDD